jgi:hypothetical protein
LHAIRAPGTFRRFFPMEFCPYQDWRALNFAVYNRKLLRQRAVFPDDPNLLFVHHRWGNRDCFPFVGNPSLRLVIMV